MPSGGSPSAENTTKVDITLLLMQWSRGDQAAFDRTSAFVYPELRRIARAYLKRERPDHTLRTTDLIHEAYLKFMAIGALRIEGRRQFYALAARLMRQILVDYARAIKAGKRAGKRTQITLDRIPGATVGLARDFLLVHEGLEDLRAVNPNKADLLELRYFGGLTLEEAAQQLGISRATAHRDQRFAEAWLNKRLSAPPDSVAAAGA